jgi:hypothetical protein
MNSEQIIKAALANVEQGIRNILDLHHIKHGGGTNEDVQIDSILTDLFSDLEKLRITTREEFVEQLKSFAKGPQIIHEKIDFKKIID